MLVNCQQCGIPFTTYPSRISRGGGKFHSKECDRKHKIGKPLPEEARKKLITFRIGSHHSEETKKKIGLSNIGKHFHSEEARKNLSLKRIGKKLSEETRKKIGKSLSKEKIKRICRGCGITFEAKPSVVANGFGIYHNHECLSNSQKGIPRTEEVINKIKLTTLGKYKGKENPNWKGGITSVTSKIRNSFENKQWRSKVFIRDDFTCRKCGDKNGGNIEAHHIKSFSILVKEVKKAMPLFDIITSCKLYTPMWNIDNGITLCENCHKNIKKNNLTK